MKGGLIDAIDSVSWELKPQSNSPLAQGQKSQVQCLTMSSLSNTGKGKI